MECRPAEMQNLGGTREDILMRMVLSGQERAFEELMNRARDRCMHVAFCLLGNRDDAHDEVQNAFWKAYTHLDTFNQQARFSTWVARIVINNCYMRLRKAGVLRLVSSEATNQDGESYVLYEATDSGTPEHSLGTTELCRVVRSELGRIPRLLRIPLQLHYLDELPLEDVARKLGVTLAAAKSRLHRGQCYLRDRMARHCGRRGAATLLRAG